MILPSFSADMWNMTTEMKALNQTKFKPTLSLCREYVSSTQEFVIHQQHPPLSIIRGWDRDAGRYILSEGWFQVYCCCYSVSCRTVVPFSCWLLASHKLFLSLCCMVSFSIRQLTTRCLSFQTGRKISGKDGSSLYFKSCPSNSSAFEILSLFISRC